MRMRSVNIEEEHHRHDEHEVCDYDQEFLDDVAFPLQLDELENEEIDFLLLGAAAAAAAAISDHEERDDDSDEIVILNGAHQDDGGVNYQACNGGVKFTVNDPSSSCDGRRCSSGSKDSKILSLVSLPEDLLHTVCTFLPIPSLASLNTINSYFHRTTNQSSFWSNHFDTLEREKVFISRHIKSIARSSRCGSNPKMALSLAYSDRERQRLTRQELVDSTWYFSFKETAGEDWTSWDPYWKSNGARCRRFKFLNDGSVMQIDETQDVENEREDATKEEGRGEDESRISLLRSRVQSNSFASDAQQRGRKRRRSVLASISAETDTENHIVAAAGAAKRLRLKCRDITTDRHGYADQQDVDGRRWSHRAQQPRLCPVFADEPRIPRISMTWRFIQHPIDFPRQDRVGGYVRLCVGGREVPTYILRRLSDGNWGFVMESCWGVFANFDVTTSAVSQSKCSTCGMDSVRTSTGLRAVRSKQFNQWDVITTERQWKEAMFYNDGVGILPEGNNEATGVGSDHTL